MTAGLYTHKDECESVKNQKNKNTLPIDITSCLITEMLEL